MRLEINAENKRAVVSMLWVNDPNHAEPTQFDQFLRRQILVAWTPLRTTPVLERFAEGEQVDSIIISVDQKNRSLNLSIKEIEIIDEKEALSKYGSSDSGASLGDILGTALKKKK